MLRALGARDQPEDQPGWTNVGEAMVEGMVYTGMEAMVEGMVYTRREAIMVHTQPSR